MKDVEQIEDHGTNALWYARAVIADLADYDDATVAEACRQIINSTDPSVTDSDRAQAADLLCLVEGEMV